MFGQDPHGINPLAQALWQYASQSPQTMNSMGGMPIGGAMQQSPLASSKLSSIASMLPGANLGAATPMPQPMPQPMPTPAMSNPGVGLGSGTQDNMSIPLALAQQSSVPSPDVSPPGSIPAPALTPGLHLGAGGMPAGLPMTSAGLPSAASPLTHIIPGQGQMPGAGMGMGDGGLGMMGHAYPGGGYGATPWGFGGTSTWAQNGAH